MSKYVIIGTGRVAHSLASAMMGTSCKLHAVVSRTMNSAKDFAETFHLSMYSDSLKFLPSDYTHCIIAVPDNAIAGCVEEILKSSAPVKGKTFIHLSGALSNQVLDLLSPHEAHIASMHIMQSFPSTAVIPIEGCTAAIEAEEEAVAEDISQFAKLIGLIPFRITAESKTLYHIMGVYLSNFFVADLYKARELFTNLGLRDIDFWKIAAPILHSTMQNAEFIGLPEALSGPVERGDTKTIETHLACLIDQFGSGSAELRDYVHKSLSLLEAAGRKNPGSEILYKEIRSILQKHLS